MIYPKRNAIIRGFFRLYLSWIIRRNFQAVNYNFIDIEHDKAILLLSSHCSWWDAFLMYYVFAKICNKRLYVMITEENMQKVGFFKYIGGFSVHKNSRNALTSLNYAAQLLNDPQNLVLIFPQGRLYSNFIDNVHFEKGVMKIMEKAEAKFQLIYAANFTETLQHKKPTANIYLSNATNCTFTAIEALNNHYQQHYNQARNQQTSIAL